MVYALMSGLVDSLDLQIPEKNKEIYDWTLVMCCASNDASGPFNHRVPAVNAAQVGSEFCPIIVQIQNAKIVAEEAAVEAENEIVLQEVDPAEGTDELPSGEAGVVLASLQDKCGHLRQWAQFVDRLLDIGFVPIKVPADGNCLAWSFKCLVESDYQGMGLDQTHPQHLEDVAALRKKLGEAWKTNSTSPAWKQNEGMQRNRGCM